MLKLNDIKSVAVGIDMSSVKTHALPHSIVNESSLSPTFSLGITLIHTKDPFASE